MTLPPNIRGVVLDLDDTLFPEAQFVRSGFMAVSQAFAGRLGPAERLFEQFEHRHRSGPRGRVFDMVLQDLGRPADANLIRDMVHVYRTHRPRIELHADAARAIARWASRGRLGVLSDGPAEMQHNKVAALNLPACIHPIILTDAWGRAFWKPHPRGFEAIMSEWGMAGADLAYVADNPAKDFGAPQALGWTTVQVRRTDGLYRDEQPAPGGEPHGVVSSFDELDWP